MSGADRDEREISIDTSHQRGEIAVPTGYPIPIHATPTLHTVGGQAVAKVRLG
jgi:hypothetical protein